MLMLTKVEAVAGPEEVNIHTHAETVFQRTPCVEQESRNYSHSMASSHTLSKMPSGKRWNILEALCWQKYRPVIRWDCSFNTFIGFVKNAIMLLCGGDRLDLIRLFQQSFDVMSSTLIHPARFPQTFR